MKRTYKSLFNLLFLTATILFLASCSRQQGAVSYNNEKLRKSSLEIENSNASENIVASSSESTAPVVVENSDKKILDLSNAKTIDKRAVNTSKAKGKKISPLKTMVAKKVAKKMSNNKTKAIEGNLKLALIFLAVAVILFILSFIPLFWLLGTIALIISIVFFVMWLLEQ